MNNHEKPVWWDVCMSGPKKELEIVPEIVEIPSKKSKKTKIIFIFLLFLFIGIGCFYFIINREIKINSIEIYCDSYIISDENRQITCDILAKPDGAVNTVTWETTNRDFISIENGNVNLQIESIDKKETILIKAISMENQSIVDEQQITLLPKEEVDIIPICSLTILDSIVKVDEQVKIMVNCSSKKKLVYQTQSLLYDKNDFELVSTENEGTTNTSFTHIYYLRPLKIGSSIITLPEGYATSNNISNYKNTLKIDIGNISTTK